MEYDWSGGSPPPASAFPLDKPKAFRVSSARYLHASTANPFGYRDRPTGKKNAETLDLSLMSTDKTCQVWPGLGGPRARKAYIELESRYERFERHRNCRQQRLQGRSVLDCGLCAAGAFRCVARHLRPDPAEIGRRTFLGRAAPCRSDLAADAGSRHGGGPPFRHDLSPPPRIHRP